VLTPLQGVAWAAFFNFVAAFVFARRLRRPSRGLIDINEIDTLVIFSGLVGAITWDLITWRIGLPTSSSHALIAATPGRPSSRRASTFSS